MELPLFYWCLFYSIKLAVGRLLKIKIPAGNLKLWKEKTFASYQGGTEAKAVEKGNSNGQCNCE